MMWYTRNGGLSCNIKSNLLYRLCRCGKCDRDSISIVIFKSCSMLFQMDGRQNHVMPLNSSSKQYLQAFVKSIRILLLLVASRVCCIAEILVINGAAHTNRMYSNMSLSISISSSCITQSKEVSLLNSASTSDCDTSVGVIVFVSSSGVSSISSSNRCLTTFKVSTNLTSWMLR